MLCDAKDIGCSSANWAKWAPFKFGESLVKILNKVGEKTAPWGTPAFISTALDFVLPTTTEDCRLVRNDFISFIMYVGKLNVFYL